MCDDCEFALLLERIEEILDAGHVDWARDTLEGIHDWVGAHGHATAGQIEAVDNIEAAAR